MPPGIGDRPRPLLLGDNLGKVLMSAIDHDPCQGLPGVAGADGPLNDLGRSGNHIDPDALFRPGARGEFGANRDTFDFDGRPRNAYFDGAIATEPGKSESAVLVRRHRLVAGGPAMVEDPNLGTGHRAAL